MSALSNQPTNLNYLSPIGFKFSLNRIPTFTYFIQSINVPNISFGNIQQPTPFIKLPIPGDQLQFGELLVTFKIDEDMRAYTDIYDWMFAMGHPDYLQQYAAVAPLGAPGGFSSSKGPYSDATLTILSSASNPTVNIVFRDLFPISLSDFTFDSKASSVEYLEASVTFAYKKFDVVRL